MKYLDPKNDLIFKKVFETQCQKDGYVNRSNLRNYRIEP